MCEAARMLAESGVKNVSVASKYIFSMPIKHHDIHAWRHDSPAAILLNHIIAAAVMTAGYFELPWLAGRPRCLIGGDVRAPADILGIYSPICLTTR